MTKAARSRGFPEALREQIAAWDQLRSGCRSAHDLIRDVHAWLASQPADETAALRADIRELQRNALPSNCTRCNGLGAEPPGCPESGPCERCGGWTSHKRLVAGEADALRARVKELESAVEARTRATNRALDRYREESDALRAVDSRTRAKIAESGYQRGVEEAATAALTTARHCQISSFVDGRTYELLDRDEVVRAIRALATRGAT